MISEAVRYVAQVLAALAFAHAARRNSSRHQACQHPDRAGRRGQVDRFRHCALRLYARASPAPVLPWERSPTCRRSRSERGEVDARSDLYSLGLTFYEMVTGRRAIQAETEHALMIAQMNTLPPEPGRCESMACPAPSPTPLCARSRRIRAIASKAHCEFQAALQASAETPPSGAAALSRPVPRPSLLPNWPNWRRASHAPLGRSPSRWWPTPRGDTEQLRKSAKRSLRRSKIPGSAKLFLKPARPSRPRCFGTALDRPHVSSLRPGPIARSVSPAPRTAPHGRIARWLGGRAEPRR